MSKHKKNHETETAATQNGEAFVSAAAPTETAAPVKKRKLGAWAITGIAAAGLVVLAGTAGAGAVAGIAAAPAIVSQQGDHEFAEAGHFGGEHEGRGGEFGEKHERGDDEMRGQMPQGPKSQQGQMQEGQSQQGEPQQGQQQMQRPNMNGMSGAS